MKLLEVLNELLMLHTDLERLQRYGEEIIEEFEEGPYTLILTKNIHHNMYQIGLTSNEQEFTTSQSQEKKLTDKSVRVVLQSWSRISRKVREWLDKYGEINVGSFNVPRTHKYRRMLSNFGIDCGDVQTNSHGAFFVIRP
jgi:hypothetical protein